ncbi:MAG: hypothetical protein H6855_02435 [Rhodospirillales bacterium]|nr:hypothetical protein [Rhodospirillales bacterium]MCB9964924.1 hypothetical protein [Rhodospirillales bacterium]MCB9973718.1 hypothetical protein [Rhodospirillales bacterium]
MLEIREIITGALIGIGIILCICAALYGPDYIREISYPSRQKVQLIAVGKYSFRDWAFRLRDENIKNPHLGYIRTPVFSLPVKLLDIKYVDQGGTRRVYGQFESQASQVDFFGKFEATVKEKGPSRIEADILSGKNSNDIASLSRISGKISFIENINTGLIEGDLQIGSANYGGLPFGGTQLRIKGDRKLVGAEILTHVSGHQGTTFKIIGGFEDGTLKDLSGDVEIDNLQGLIETINMLASGETFTLPDYFKSFRAFHIGFHQKNPEAGSYDRKEFELTSKTLGKKFNGIAQFQSRNNVLKLAGRMVDVWPQAYPSGLTQTAGHTLTQGVLELSLNQKNDDVFGPYMTVFHDVTLEKGPLKLKGLNGSLTYDTLFPVEGRSTDFQLQELDLGPDTLKNIKIKQLALVDGILEIGPAVTVEWRELKFPLSMEYHPEDDVMEFKLKENFQNTSRLSDILRFDFSFSGALGLEKIWSLQKDKLISHDMILKNTTPGILTLNESVPELSNIFVKNLSIDLESDKIARLKVKGRHPTVYGASPVTLNTSIERFVEE